MKRALLRSIFFFFNDTATTEIYTLSLHDALPIYQPRAGSSDRARAGLRLRAFRAARPRRAERPAERDPRADRKSTRLNSSHSQISYAVFCLKKKNHHVRPGHPTDRTVADTVFATV